jgi:hypothetical protein
MICPAQPFSSLMIGSLFVASDLKIINHLVLTVAEHKIIKTNYNI